MHAHTHTHTCMTHKLAHSSTQWCARAHTHTDELTHARTSPTVEACTCLLGAWRLACPVPCASCDESRAVSSCLRVSHTLLGVSRFPRPASAPPSSAAPRARLLPVVLRACGITVLGCRGWDPGGSCVWRRPDGTGGRSGRQRMQRLLLTAGHLRPSCWQVLGGAAAGTACPSSLCKSARAPK